LIILHILGEEYKSWSSSLCSFLCSPVIPSLFAPNILLRNPILTLVNIYICITGDDTGCEDARLLEDEHEEYLTR
jgi:hypothetical protein